MKMNNAQDCLSRDPADWHLAKTRKAQDIVNAIIATILDALYVIPDNIKHGALDERQTVVDKIVKHIDIFTECYYQLNAPPGYNSPEFKTAYRNMISKLLALT
jgi:hypothetical protein